MGDGASLSTGARLGGNCQGMIILAAFILGAAIGWFRATRLGGNRADKLQYALAHALALTVLGLLVTVILARSA